MTQDAVRGSALFTEVQYFRQPWLVALLLAVAGVDIFILVRQVFLGHPVGSNPAPDWLVVVLFLLFGLGLPWLFLSARLVLEVHSDCLRYRFIPFHGGWKTLHWHEFSAQCAVTYHPIREYGGWGIRCGRHGRAYNVSGNRGVRFELAGGRTLLFGSRQAERFSNAVQEASGKGPGSQGRTG